MQTTELNQLRREVRIGRVVTLLAILAVIAIAATEPTPTVLTVQGVELIDDDGAVVGRLHVADGEGVLSCLSARYVPSATCCETGLRGLPVVVFSNFVDFAE